MPLPYIYRWNRLGRKGQPCAVEARGSMNSCLVRFADGYGMVTSRNALMRNPAAQGTPGEQAIRRETKINRLTRRKSVSRNKAEQPQQTGNLGVFWWVL